MAPRNRNRNNQRANQRMTSRTAAPAAPTLVQQPKPNYSSSSQNARYITDLNPAGSPEFNRWNEKLGGNYDGGGWVTWNKNLGPGDSGMLASDDDMRQLARANAYREMNNIGLMNRGSQESDAAKFQAAQGQSPSTTASSQKSYKDIKSIAGGLKIGGDNILGRREAMKIARGTGKGYDDVITKALGRGMSIGGGTVKQSNRAYEKSGQAVTDRAMGALAGESPLSEMRRVTPGKRQMYSGTYQLDGQTMPLIESRRGGTNSLGIGGRGKRGGKGRSRAGSMTETATATTAGSGSQPSMDYQAPAAAQESVDRQQPDIGMMAGGGAGVGGATKLGRAKSRLRQLGIYGRGTGLLGRGLQYGNVLNA